MGKLINKHVIQALIEFQFYLKLSQSSYDQKSSSIAAIYSHAGMNRSSLRSSPRKMISFNLVQFPTMDEEDVEK